MVFSYYIKEKGQMSAPFELLVAVIIMGFVIIVGSQMLAAANKEVCVNNIDRELTEFKQNLEDSVNIKNSNTFRFDNPDGCFNEKDAIIRIEKNTNAQQCSAICSRAENSCYVLLFSIPKSGIFKQKCLNISRFTSFSDDGTNCPNTNLPGYVATDPTTGGVKVGNYVIRNVSKAGETYPNICVFWGPGGIN